MSLRWKSRRSCPSAGRIPGSGALAVGALILAVGACGEEPEDVPFDVEPVVIVDRSPATDDQRGPLVPGLVDFALAEHVLLLDGIGYRENPLQWRTRPEKKVHNLSVHLPWPGSRPSELRIQASSTSETAQVEVLWNGRRIGELRPGPEADEVVFALPEDLELRGLEHVELRSSFGFAGPKGRARIRVDHLRVTAPDSRDVSEPEGTKRIDPGQVLRLWPSEKPWIEWQLGLRADEPTSVQARVYSLAERKLASSEVHTVSGEPLVLSLASLGRDDSMIELFVPAEASPVELVDSQLVLGRQSPNLVLIVVDTLRADAILDEQGEVALPSLAALAADGVVFRQCFSHASMTLPAHASLFSSRLAYDSGVFKNGDDVDPELPLLAEHLAQNGYSTSAAVSIGALRFRPGKGLSRGFQTYLDDIWGVSWAAGSLPKMVELLDDIPTDRPHFLFAHFADPHDPYRNHGGEQWELQVTLGAEPPLVRPMIDALDFSLERRLAPGVHRIELRADREYLLRTLVVRDVAREQSLPLTFSEGADQETQLRTVVEFEIGGDEEADVQIQLWVTDVPDVPEAIERYGLEVEYVDGYIGRLLDELKARGLYDSSLIVFTSDHGEGLWQHEWLVHVENVYDEQLKVPLIMKLPKGVEGVEYLSERRDELVRHIDVTPTLLEVLGVPPLPEQRGISLFQGRLERPLIAQTHKPIASRDLFCMRDERYKLIYDVEADRFEMYDIVRDPGELEDIFGKKGGKRSEWQATLRSVAQLSMSAALDHEVSEEDQDRLKALGY